MSREPFVKETTPPPRRSADAAKLLETGIYLLCIFIGIGGILKAKDFPHALPVGPGLVPVLSCSVLGILSLAGLIGLWRKSASGEAPRNALDGRRTALIVAVMFGYLVLLELLPFLVSTLILAIAWYAISLGRPNVTIYSSQWLSWAGIVLFVVAVYLVFSRVLNVSFF